MLYCIGIYIMLLLKNQYQSPRPFWVDGDIDSFKGMCEFDFVAPSSHVFTIVFYWQYNILMYFTKYIPTNQKINWTLVICLEVLLVVVSISNLFMGYLFGLMYIYQMVTSILWSFTFLVFCLIFDDQIFTYLNNIGFIIKTSRRDKFYLLFACIGLFAFQMSLVLLHQNDDNEYMWIKNASLVSKFFLNESYRTNNNVQLNCF